MMTLRRSLLLLCLPLAAAADPGTLHDPTRPYGALGARTDSGDAAWRLTATRITPDRRSAVINARRVYEGDEFDGVRIVRIRHAQVDIATPAGPTTLRLLPAEVKKHR